MGYLDQIQQKFKKLGCDKSGYWQSYTGNSIRKLLTNSFELLTDIIPDSSVKNDFGQIMATLAELQSYSRADFLNREDFANLTEILNNFTKQYTVNLRPNICAPI